MRLGASIGACVAVAGVVVACGTAAESSFLDTDAGAPLPGSDPGFGAGGQKGAAEGASCTPKTCKELGIGCGPAGDGCGGKLDDCGTCASPTTCGGGGVPSQCGGASACVPRSCAELGIECGPAGDGCGGLLDCSVCPSPQICGGGGPSKCGGGQLLPDGGALLPDGGLCTPRACTTGECGPVADGCGGLLQCGGCAAGETCGGGGVASTCGAPSCVKTTCQAQAANCGYVADGCGGLLDCGGPDACPAGEMCGGGGPNTCGSATPAPTCENFCNDQAKNCPVPTRVTGKVYAPNGTLPLPGALVYVPNASKQHPYGVASFTDGVAGGACDQCSTQASGAPLVTTTTAWDGSFTLENVPAGVAFPLVVQLGRWRRLVTVPAVAACGAAALPASLTRLPTRQREGNDRDNIPLVAISTGRVDALECVFRKLGIESNGAGQVNQFTNPGGTGRIRLYQDEDGGSGAGGGHRIDATTPRVTQLLDTAGELDRYDAVIFGCRGAALTRTQARLAAVRNYADRGGRVFATHFSYGFVNTNGSWASSVTWDTANARQASSPWAGAVDATPGKRETFSKWLGAPGVTALTSSGPPPVITIDEARNNADLPISSAAESWITKNDDAAGAGRAVLHYTFNTPFAEPDPQKQCGRVLFSDFHVTIGSVDDRTNFPNGCTSTALTAQEKVLAFMLFDLTSCIEPTAPPPPPVCPKKTCAQQNIACGPAGDACGGSIDCGPCPEGQICQGSPAACITPGCTKTTCADKLAECGQIADGCGGTASCGTCPRGTICGGAGPNRCGANTCDPITCEAQGIECGPAGDGCGGLLACGTCPPGQTCGGGGQPGKCGAPTCTKRTCAAMNAECGFVADGCGGLLDCGTCAPGRVCGGSGTANQCSEVTTGPK